MGDLGRGALLPDLGAEVDRQLPRRLSRLRKVLDRDDAADAHVDRQEVLEVDHPTADRCDYACPGVDPDGVLAWRRLAGVRSAGGRRSRCRWGWCRRGEPVGGRRRRSGRRRRGAGRRRGRRRCGACRRDRACRWGWSSSVGVLPSGARCGSGFVSVRPGGGRWGGHSRGRRGASSEDVERGRRDGQSEAAFSVLRRLGARRQSAAANEASRLTLREPPALAVSVECGRRERPGPPSGAALEVPSYTPAASVCASNGRDARVG